MVNPEVRARHEKVIRALQAKTVEHGATEAEALAAAAKVKELMDRYEIDELTEEEVIGEGAIRMWWVADNVYEAETIWGCLASIGKFTDTKLYWDISNKHQEVKPLGVMGLRSDIDFALYLLNTLSAFGLGGAALQPFHDRSLYLRGYSTGINERLLKLIQDRDEKVSTGRALVVVNKKAEAINEFLVRDGLKLETIRRSAVTINSAVEAGMRHAQKATFHRPMDGDERRRLG